MMTSSNGNNFRVTGLCPGNSPVTDEFPSQRPVTRNFDLFFDLHLNKRLNKQSLGWWFETLCAHYDVAVIEWWDHGKPSLVTMSVVTAWGHRSAWQQRLPAVMASSQFSCLVIANKLGHFHLISMTIFITHMSRYTCCGWHVIMTLECVLVDPKVIAAGYLATHARAALKT